MEYRVLNLELEDTLEIIKTPARKRVVQGLAASVLLVSWLEMHNLQAPSQTTGSESACNKITRGLEGTFKFQMH